MVEHQLVQIDADGDVFYGDPVRDTYGGSWIVSERSDGSRLIIDLSRRLLTEVQPARGSYWSIPFDRLARLNADLVAADDASVQEALDRRQAKSAGGAAEQESLSAPRLVVEHVAEAEPAALLRLRQTLRGKSQATAKAARPGIYQSAPGVRHLRVSVEVEGSPSPKARAGMPSAVASPPVLDVWVDARFRLGPSALRALRSFELDVLAPPPARRALQPVLPAMLLAAARETAQGAFPLRTVRTLHARPELPEGAEGVLEDVVLSIDRVEALPTSLIQVPEGLRRVLHPLETMVRVAEDELETRRAMSGEAAAEGISDSGGGDR